jgi:hypothetical protein
VNGERASDAFTQSVTAFDSTAFQTSGFNENGSIVNRLQRETLLPFKFRAQSGAGSFPVQ